MKKLVAIDVFLVSAELNIKLPGPCKVDRADQIVLCPGKLTPALRAPPLRVDPPKHHKLSPGEKSIRSDRRCQGI
jgi:hypothetical protein